MYPQQKPNPKTPKPIFKDTKVERIKNTEERKILKNNALNIGKVIEVSRKDKKKARISRQS